MKHPFICADATTFPVEWKAAVPPVDRTGSFALLQGRELTENDYTMLLGLDANNVSPMHRHLVQGLKKTNPILMKHQRGLEDCSICKSPLTCGDTSLRLLPCSNNCCVHESCAMNIFVEAQSNNKLANVCCPICDDGVAFFPALKRQPKRRKPKPVATEADSVAAVEAALEVGVGGLGIGGLMLTGSIFSSGIASSTGNAAATEVSERSE